MSQGVLWSGTWGRLMVCNLFLFQWWPLHALWSFVIVTFAQLSWWSDGHCCTIMSSCPTCNYRGPTSLSDIIVKATNPWMLWQLVPALLKHRLASHSFTSILLVTLMRGWVIIGGPYGSLPHSLIIHIIDCCFFRKALQWVSVGFWRCFGRKAKVKGIQRDWHV